MALLLGIYFGPKTINLVEVKGKRLLNNIQIPNLAPSAGSLEDKVPEEIKIVALLKEQLRKYQIESKEAIIALSGKDLIIRTFSIPVLPAAELPNAVSFEAKKYIPFKIENLVTSFQTRPDKLSRTLSVLFVGIKKETLEKYITILRQLNISIASIEYSAFSIFRLIELSKLKAQGAIGIINADFNEGDGADFTVIDKGFPLFSCDIKLGAGAVDIPKTTENENAILEKFRSEIRISLDYYNHKFPLKKIRQIFFIGQPVYLPKIETIAKELGLLFKFVDTSKAIEKPVTLNLSFLKAYSAALSWCLKGGNVNINLLSAWNAGKQLRSLSGKPEQLVATLLSGFKIQPLAILLAFLFLGASFFAVISKKLPLEKELQAIIMNRPAVSNINPQAAYDEFKQFESGLKKNIVIIDGLLKKQVYLTPQLSSLVKLIPEGMWLERISFKNTDKETAFSLDGRVFLNDSDKEIEVINTFLSSLKKEPGFSHYCKDIKIISLNTTVIKGKTVTNWTISGTN